MIRFEFDKKAAITLFICFDYTGFVVYHVDHDMYYGYNNAQYTYVWYNPMENDFRVVTMFPRRNGGEITSASFGGSFSEVALEEWRGAKIDLIPFRGKEILFTKAISFNEIVREMDL